MNGFDALSQSGYDMRREVLIDAALQAMGALIIATSRDGSVPEETDLATDAVLYAMALVDALHDAGAFD